MSGCSMQATFSRRIRDNVSHNVRGRTVLLQSPLLAPSSVLRFHKVKIDIMALVASCSLYTKIKIIKFYRRIQLLQTKT